MPSDPMAAPPPKASETTPVPSAPAVLALSESVFAGTRTAPLVSGSEGSHCNSRTASRKRSVAARTTELPSISTRTPVSIGNVSSLPAATATCEMASANSCDGIVPVMAGTSGNCG